MGLFDDDDDNAGRGSRSEVPITPRPLTISFAVLWFVIVAVASLSLFALTASVRESASSDIVNAVACQAAAYLACVWVMLRLHAPDRPLADAIGLRPTHPALYLLALLLGVALQVPADWLQFLVGKVWPLPAEMLEEQHRMLSMSSPLQRIMVPFVVAGLGPAVEETFFRGVLHTGLRKTHGSVIVVLIVSALFAGAHASPQLFIPLFAVGLVLTVLRAMSGSLFPSLIAHMAFNAVAVISLMMQGDTPDDASQPLPLPISAGGIGATVVLLAGVAIVAWQSVRARKARQEDAA